MEAALPMRSSALSRKKASKPTLLRLSLGPNGVPFVDLLGRAPGRGVYVESERAILEEALSPKGLGRIFKGRAAQLGAKEQAAMIEDTIARLEERIVELCSLARRAGKLEIGMDATLRLLGGKSAAGIAVVAAKDISVRSEEEIIRALPQGARFVRAGTKVMFGSKLGRDEVAVVGVAPSVLSERIGVEGDRLFGLRAPSMSSTNPAPLGRVRRRSEGGESRRSEDQD